MRIRDIVKKILIERENRSYRKRLAEQKLTYTQWVERDEAAKKARPVKDAVDFVVWKQAKGQLAKEAMHQLAAYFEAHPECSILYGDEDVLRADGERENPWVKTCWSPDTYLSCFYPGSVIAIRRELLAKAGIAPESDMIAFEQAAQIRLLMDELFALAGGFEKASTGIARVPYVLFHVPSGEVWENYFQSAGRQILQETTASADREAEAAPAEGKSAGVSVIIPSKDNPEVLANCLDSLKKLNADLEIIVVDNGSDAENKQRIEKLTEGMKYIYQPMPFNFSRMCNTGAENATKELLLFLNDDIEVCESGWLQAMSHKALQPYVGAVGLKLYYPDSDLIQHAGVVNLPIGPDHKLLRFPDSEAYYFGWNRFNRNCLAVTAACLMIENRKFKEIGGFLTDLAVNYNDVDLCMRLYEQGYQNVVINEYHAYHHESLSRGANDRPEKMEALIRERELLYKLHPAIKDTDPYFPKELDRRGLHSKIQPAFVYTVQELQPASWKKSGDIKNVRYDQCLMARVEICDAEKIQGFGIVLGDNNACYRRYLVLNPTDETETDGQKAEREKIFPADCLMMQLEDVYRCELEENVPDQMNVALGGFCIRRDDAGIVPGRYSIGMLAVHKISGLKLFSWTGKDLTVK